MYDSNRNSSKVSFDIRQLLGKYQFRLKSYPWLTIHQKKLLIEYIGSCQVNFFVLNLTQNPLHISCLIELLLHNFFFQQYVIEFLGRNIKYRRFILKSCSVTKNVANIIKWLGELKYFRHKKGLSFKKIVIVSARRKKRQHSKYGIVDLLVQQLFVLVLNSRVKANTELNNYSFNPSFFLVKSKGNIRNILYYRLFLNSEMFGHASVDTCFYLLNYILLLKNIFVPLKYEYIFKSWLFVKQVKYSWAQKNKNNLKMFLIGIIGFLWIHSVFNAIYRLIYGIAIKSRISIRENFLRNFSSHTLKLFCESKLWGNSFVKRFLYWDFFWGINSFAVLSNSRKFLSILAKKIQSFFFTQSLHMQIKIRKIIWFRAHINSYLLGSIFSGSIRSITAQKRLFYATNKVYRYQFQRKLLLSPFVISLNFSRFFFIMSRAVSWYYSVYNIILVLNHTIIEWMNHCMLNYQKIWGFVRFWLCKWFLLRVKRLYCKNFKLFLSKHYPVIKYFGFRNHLETLCYLIKINRTFLTRTFVFGFLKNSKTNFKYWRVAVPRITVL